MRLLTLLSRLYQCNVSSGLSMQPPSPFPECIFYPRFSTRPPHCAHPATRTFHTEPSEALLSSSSSSFLFKASIVGTLDLVRPSPLLQPRGAWSRRCVGGTGSDLWHGLLRHSRHGYSFTSIAGAPRRKTGGDGQGRGRMLLAPAGTAAERRRHALAMACSHPFSLVQLQQQQHQLKVVETPQALSLERHFLCHGEELPRPHTSRIGPIVRR